MNDDERPDPDKLLEAIKRQESDEYKGHLKIFLGMAAGVGKTYAMLEAAQKRKREGVNVVVGTVNTHGRKETAALLEGLTIIPEKWIKYKDTVFEELDIDEILRQKPSLVLVDELAHTNIPGSRHEKRWQDVIELLENGIDVYTTLNVQHIESLKDLIENIAGIQIRETVPDKIIETASSIELVDITPEELRQRLKEGKVYLGDKSLVAAENFFKEDRLTALREVVLRYAAEKVDHDLQGMMSVERKSGWKPRERLLVAVSSSPFSQKLIRTTRRLAYNQGAPWIALHVNDGRVLSEAEKTVLTKNLALSRDLGAEIITTNDPNISQAIERVARQKGVTQIILGRPPKRYFWNIFPRRTLLDQLAIDCNDIDIHVIRQIPSIKNNREFILSFTDQASSYPIIFISVFGVIVLNFLLEPFLGYRIVGFLFLISILILAQFFRKGPIFFATIIYALVWDYFFVPPKGSFEISSGEDLAFLFLYFLTAIFTGIWIDRAKQNKEMLVKREEATQALYDITKEIASSSLSTEVFKNISQKLGFLLGGECNIVLQKLDNGLSFANVPTLDNNEKEKAAAQWVFDNGKEAGWSTTTLSGAKHLFIPLKGYQEIVGVLTYEPIGNKELSLEEKSFLYSVSQQIANHIERLFLQERQRQYEYYNQIEKIYQSILNLLSKQFDKPVKIIQEAVKDLKEENIVKEGKLGLRTVHRIENYSEGLNRILENISTMAKLSAGLAPIQMKKNSIKEVVNACCEDVKELLKTRRLIVNIPDDLPPIYFDFSQIEILICNLILNAIENSPPGSIIELIAKLSENYLILSVLDEGKGIPENLTETIFEKFFKLPDDTSSGIGLGLSIAKTIAENHGGLLKAENRPIRGAKFSLLLPRSF